MICFFVFFFFAQIIFKAMSLFGMLRTSRLASRSSAHTRSVSLLASLLTPTRLSPPVTTPLCAPGRSSKNLSIKKRTAINYKVYVCVWVTFDFKFNFSPFQFHITFNANVEKNVSAIIDFWSHLYIQTKKIRILFLKKYRRLFENIRKWNCLHKKKGKKKGKAKITLVL